MDKRANNKKEKKGSAAGIFTAFLAVLAMNVLGADGALYILLPVLVIGAVIAIAVFTFKKSYKKTAAGQYTRKSDPPEDRTYVPRHEAAPQRQYYESTDVFDSRERDKARRIAQLKVFLDNGIIDKAEYNVLLNRYKNDI